MIVRTYGRRSRSFSDGGGGGGGGGERGGGFSSSQDAFEFDGEDDDLVLLGSSSQPPAPSQESSSMWDFDEDPPQQPPPRRRRGRGGDYAEPATVAATSLMEAEEYGEMMESVDEVNFALDGLRATAPRRVRRASFLALLGICASAPRRRVLRAQGLVQQIIDAILVLNIDDPPCTIGAAALLFVLASDVKENHLLDSESCVHFLLKLLNPPPVNLVDSKAPSIGSKLLGISKVQMLNGSNKDSDCISEEILSKVEEILLNCQEIKSVDKDDKKTTRPELCPKWLALLTMEKACLSAVSVEETSDTVTRVGGSFKETLRELGGLYSIFDVMVDCHSTLENLIKDTSTSALDLNEGTSLQSAALLLKCLKILENATFLSDDNKAKKLASTNSEEPSSSSRGGQQQDSRWLRTLSDPELDLLISLKDLAMACTDNASLAVLGHDYDLPTLRALGIVLLETLKERLKETSIDPSVFDKLALLSDSDAHFPNIVSDSESEGVRSKTPMCVNGKRKQTQAGWLSEEGRKKKHRRVKDSSEQA